MGVIYKSDAGLRADHGERENKKALRSNLRLRLALKNWFKYTACSVISLRYGSLNGRIGVDEASCAGRRSSPVDIPRALRVPSAEAPSALQYFPEMIATYRRIFYVGWVECLARSSCFTEVLQGLRYRYDCTRYSCQVNLIKGVVRTSVPQVGFI